MPTPQETAADDKRPFTGKGDDEVFMMKTSSSTNIMLVQQGWGPTRMGQLGWAGQESHRLSNSGGVIQAE